MYLPRDGEIITGKSSSGGFFILRHSGNGLIVDSSEMTIFTQLDGLIRLHSDVVAVSIDVWRVVV